ncbi:GNAT family N-acetyltransferase [Lichenicoccus sp.]|uniref:GNAT family N-acetyltransferase n=1 Tax=Lichenicoccus sp. TaxID=2781899 RepID=UPI003D114F6B
MSIVTAAYGDDTWHAMVALRRRVLRAPLGLDYDPAQLDAERDQLHLAVIHDGMVAGTLLIVPPDPLGTGRLRQMAVAPELRRRGFGAALVRHAEALLGGMGAVCIGLSARESAVAFYEALGFAPCGAPYVEVTLPHVRMGKRLSTP